jgi:hypothetical protein
MPALTRRRDNDPQREGWFIYFGDVRVGHIGVATGMIAAIESPLDLLSQPRKKPKKSRKDQPPA